MGDTTLSSHQYGFYRAVLDGSDVYHQGVWVDGRLETTPERGEARILTPEECSAIDIETFRYAAETGGRRGLTEIADQFGMPVSEVRRILSR